MQQKNQFTAKRAMVIGLGISGQSAARFLLARGAFVVGVDRNASLPSTNPKVVELLENGMIFDHEDDIGEVSDFDLVVVSPGVSPEHPIYAKALQSRVEVIGEVELACREITKPCLAVTGTNGKTTVTLLTTHVLQSAGIKALALGNVGSPLTSAVDDLQHSQADIFVIELSSFQLETLTTRFIDAAVILNITPDHLDRYASMDKYAAAKIGIEKNLKDHALLYVESKCHRDFGRFFKAGSKTTFGENPTDSLFTDLKEVFNHNKKVFTLPEKYQGKRSHEIQNMMAAYALCMGRSITPEEFLIGLTSFQKPSHRIEFVRTVDGVNYYDDSKGTNIDAVIRAVEYLEGQIILIAGGVDKGFPYKSWIVAFNGKVKAVCAIGQSKEKIQNDLGNFIPVKVFTGLDQAVDYAAGIAKAGDNVLLSPGCSSFDMFKDYVHRGQEFQRIINALKEN